MWYPTTFGEGLLFQLRTILREAGGSAVPVKLTPETDADAMVAEEEDGEKL